MTQILQQLQSRQETRLTDLLTSPSPPHKKKHTENILPPPMSITVHPFLQTLWITYHKLPH